MIKNVETSTDSKDLDKHSKDMSIFEVRPEIIAYPKDSQDLSELVQYASSTEGVSLTARAGGTDMTGGPLGESVVMSFSKYMNKFSVDPENLKATVEPGLFYRDFEFETEKHGVELPSYPASKSICALGGMIMNNSGGEKTLRYGQTRKYVQSMKMVLSDGNEYEFKKLTKDEVQKKKSQGNFEGEIYTKLHDLFEKNYDLIQSQRPKVSKNSSGYYLWDAYDKETGSMDLTQLFSGSQGTLGILSEANLKLVSKNKHERLIVLFFKDWKYLPEVVNELLPIEPESLETFDDATLKLGLRFMPKVAKRVGESFIRFAIRFLPEVFIGLRMLSLPKLIVLVQLSENSKDILEEKTKKVLNTLSDNQVWTRVSPNKKDAEKYWVMRRESFKLLREHSQDKTAVSLVEDFCLKPEDIPKFLPEAIDLLEKNDIKTNITGHAGSGNLHIIPLVDLSEEGMKERLIEVADKFYDLVSRYQGSITAEHNDGILRTPYLEKMFSPEMLQLFQEVKNILDPKNIFNPGKKVGGSKEYFRSHMVKK